MVVDVSCARMRTPKREKKERKLWREREKSEILGGPGEGGPEGGPGGGRSENLEHPTDTPPHFTKHTSQTRQHKTTQDKTRQHQHNKTQHNTTQHTKTGLALTLVNKQVRKPNWPKAVLA